MKYECFSNKHLSVSKELFFIYYIYKAKLLVAYLLSTIDFWEDWLTISLDLHS